jgi:hypothetical protein
MDKIFPYKSFTIFTLRLMTKSQYLEFYNCLGKFRGLLVEGIFCKNESEGANGSLPFFVCDDKKSGVSLMLELRNIYKSFNYLCKGLFIKISHWYSEKFTISTTSS